MRYSLPLLLAATLSYSALISASVTGFGFLKIDKQLANQQRLAGHFQVLLVFGGAIQATAGGFLHEDFAGDYFFFELRLHLGGQFAATALFNLLF